MPSGALGRIRLGQMGNSWIMEARNSLLPSYPTTLSQATFKGWMDIMYAAVDSREVSGGCRDVAGERAKGEDSGWRHSGTCCPSLTPSRHLLRSP